MKPYFLRVWLVSVVGCLLTVSNLPAADEIGTTFTYTDSTAKSVDLAGEFSDWNPLPMTKDDSGKWTKSVHLKPGVYGYKFIVNGSDWVFDPNNSARKTVGDVDNSAVTVGGAPEATANKVIVNLVYANNSAKSVHVAGEFNQWLNAADGKVTGKNEWLMQSDGSGGWKFTTQLAPGKYKFKYVIDGGDKWETDPKLPAADDGNSVLEVRSDGAVVKDVVEVGFRYTEESAKAVFLAGDFNQWSTTSLPMKRNDAGMWTIALSLKPGRYQYKFFVDDQWKQDADNSETAEDGLGGKNSVKIVTQ